MAKYLDNTGLGILWNKIKQMFSGVPTKTSDLENDSNFVTATQVDDRFEQLIGAAPADLDTLEELAEKLQDGDDIHTALVQSISEKASKTEVAETYLAKTSYTASDVLDKLKTVDGSGSGLDADTLDGTELSKLQRLNNANVPRITSNANFNDYKTSGVYIVESGSVFNTLINTPPEAKSTNGRLIVTVNTGIDEGEFYGWQEYISDNGLFIAIRKHESTGFGDWVTVLNEGGASKLVSKKLTNENLDNLTGSFSNYWAATNTCANNPFGTAAFNLTVSRRDNSNYVNQIIISADNGEIRTRYKYGSNWSPWKKLLSEDDIKVVTLTEAEYNALTTKDSNTLYCIPE